MLLLFIPIGILVDLSEKIDKLKEFDVPFNEIVDYYLNFVWYFGNTLYPIFVFLAVIWFTSKIANNSEVIAILSSGISFNRYLKPVSYTHLRAHETPEHLVCRLLLEKKKKQNNRLKYHTIIQTNN